jgi:thymidine kinase
MSAINGKIILYNGCMFGGKSSELVNAVDRYRRANYNCVIITYSLDNRYDHLKVSGGVITHSGREYNQVPLIATDSLEKLLEDNEYDILQYSIIAIDEVQFFSDCVEFAQKLANMGKIVICAGLDANSNAKPFGRMAELACVAEEVIKLHAVCMKCGAIHAHFTIKLVPDDVETEIGGADKYMAVCRKCRYPQSEGGPLPLGDIPKKKFPMLEALAVDKIDIHRGEYDFFNLDSLYFVCNITLFVCAGLMLMKK